MDPVTIAGLAIQFAVLMAKTFRVETPTEKDFAEVFSRTRTPFELGLDPGKKQELDPDNQLKP